MAPLLIDSRDLVKYIFVSVLVMVLVFAGGISIGVQRAETFYQVGSVAHSLTLPEHVAAVESDISSQLPEKVAAGEDIDVDSPEVIATETDTDILESLQLSQQPVVKQKQKTVTTELKVSGINNDQSKDRHSDKGSVTKNDISLQQLSPAEATIITAFTSDQISKIKYSIQVGMYGRLHNAENMVTTLRSQKYEAYITDFTNKKNETRYNVRFGYFADKKSAMASLDKFKGDQDGDGYLVRFSADNIVNIADAAVVDQSTNAPVHGDAPENKKQPTAIPADLSQDKVSQADVLSDTLTKTN